MENDKTKSRKAKETSEEKKALLTEDAALGEIASDKIFEDDPELAKELAEDRKIQEKAREYKALQEARKKQKKKRILIVFSIILILILGGTLGFKYYQKLEAEKNSAAEVKVTEGQELVYAEIEKIVGNNISVNMVEKAENSENRPVASYTETGESAEYQIPVGTSVITKLGTTATFTSLSKGEVIAVALESGTDIIDKIWIIE